MADQKITQLTELTALVGTQVVPIVEDPGGTPVTKKVELDTLADLFSKDSIYRQAVINGNMDVWQRGTSFAYTGTQTYHADRWETAGGSSGAFTMSRQDGTGVAGARYCFRSQRNSGNTNTNGIYHGYSMETADAIKFRGQYLTVTFWARAGANFSDADAKLAFYLKEGTGTDESIIDGYTGSTTVINGELTAALTTTWTKYTFTTGSAIGATANELGFYFIWTPAGTAGAADYVEFTQFQMNVGTVALPFQPKSCEEELRVCMRYYEKSWEYGTAVGSSTNYGSFHSEGTATASTNAFWGTIYYRVPKRSAVTPTIYDGVGNANACYRGGDNKTASAQEPTTQSFRVLCADTTSARGILCHWVANAEL